MTLTTSRRRFGYIIFYDYLLKGMDDSLTNLQVIRFSAGAHNSFVGLDHAYSNEERTKTRLHVIIAMGMPRGAYRAVTRVKGIMHSHMFKDELRYKLKKRRPNGYN